LEAFLVDLDNEQVLGLGLLGVSLYFTVMVARAAQRLWLFHRLRPTALLTWRPRRPGYLSYLLALGFVAAGLAVVTAARQRPLFHVYSQAVMAVYFVLIVPLMCRLPRGLFRDGIWTENGFLEYERIRRMAFLESPEIVLILVPRGRLGLARKLEVPAGEYGAVRKVLEEKARARVLNVDQGILRL
jgi:hypothetical protein